MIDSAQNNNESIKMRCLRKKLEAASPYCIRCEKKWKYCKIVRGIGKYSIYDNMMYNNMKILLSSIIIYAENQ